MNENFTHLALDTDWEQLFGHCHFLRHPEEIITCLKVKISIARESLVSLHWDPAPCSGAHQGGFRSPVRQKQRPGYLTLNPWVWQVKRPFCQMILLADFAQTFACQQKGSWPGLELENSDTKSAQPADTMPRCCLAYASSSHYPLPPRALTLQQLSVYSVQLHPFKDLTDRTDREGRARLGSNPGVRTNTAWQPNWPWHCSVNTQPITPPFCTFELFCVGEGGTCGVKLKMHQGKEPPWLFSPTSVFCFCSFDTIDKLQLVPNDLLWLPLIWSFWCSTKNCIHREIKRGLRQRPFIRTQQIVYLLNAKRSGIKNFRSTILLNNLSLGLPILCYIQSLWLQKCPCFANLSVDFLVASGKPKTDIPQTLTDKQGTELWRNQEPSQS